MTGPGGAGQAGARRRAARGKGVHRDERIAAAALRGGRRARDRPSLHRRNALSRRPGAAREQRCRREAGRLRREQRGRAQRPDLSGRHPAISALSAAQRQAHPARPGARCGGRRQAAARTPYGNDPFGGFFGGPLFSGVLRTVRPVRLHGNPIVLSVRPRPAGAVGSYWLPARDVTLSAAWDPAKLTARAGDPVTLDLDLQATGLTAAQLPDLSSLLRFPSGPQGLSGPGEARLTRARVATGRQPRPDHCPDGRPPGHYTIPALTRHVVGHANQPTPHGDAAGTDVDHPARARRRRARCLGSARNGRAADPDVGSLASWPIALAGGRTRPRAQKSAPMRHARQWEWISIGLAVVWLATLGAWLWSRRSQAPARPSALATPWTSAHAEPARARRPMPPGSARPFARLARPTTRMRRERICSPGRRRSGAPRPRASTPSPRGSATPPSRSCSAISIAPAMPAAPGKAARSPRALTGLPPASAKSTSERDGLAPLYP